MKRTVMARAWEIYRTLTGDRSAKMSMALRRAWAEVKAAAKAGRVEAGWQVEKLEEMGASRWVKYGKDRLYLSDCGEKIMGLSIERYRSGNVSYAELDGEKISNAEAIRYLDAFSSAYIDMKSGAVCGVYGRHADDFMKALSAYAA